MKISLISMALSTMILPATAEVYHAPKDVGSFDLSSIQLDADRLKQLSFELYQIAAREHDTHDANALRTNAQLLYLARELGHQSKQITELNQLYLKAKKHTPVDANQLTKNQKTILNLAHHLSKESANKDSKLLALMIKDCLVSIAPHQQLLKDHKVNDQRWNGIVPQLKAYKESGNHSKKQLAVAKKDPKPKAEPPNHKLNILHFASGVNEQLITDSKHLERVNEYGKDALKITRKGFIEFENKGIIKRNQPLTVHLLVHLKKQQYGSVIGRMNKNQNHRGWDIWINRGKLCFEMNHSYPNNSLKVTTVEAVPIDQWSNLTITYDGSSKASGVSIYVNGTKVESNIENNSLKDSILNDAELRIATRSHNHHSINHLLLAKVDLLKGVQTKNQIKQFIKGGAVEVIAKKQDPSIDTSRMIGTMRLPEGSLKLRQKKFTILTPMLQESRDLQGDKITKSILAKVKFEAHSHHDEDHHMQFELWPNNDYMGFLWKSRGWLNKSMRHTFGKVAKTKVVMTTNFRYSQKNGQAISGPAAVAIGASVLDKKIASGTTVCAQSDDKGQLSRPSNLWLQLPGLLASGKPHRVIVGKGSQDYFKQIIAMEKPEFFILNEVIETDSLVTAIELATKSNPKLEEASALFAAVQGVSKGRAVERMSYNKKVREKLDQVLALNPNHISAKMVLLWGSGDRPESVERKYTAMTLQPIFDSYSWLKKKKRYDLSQRHLKKMAADVSNLLDDIRPFIARDDLDLYEQIEDSTKLMKSLSRAIDKEDDDSSKKRNTEAQLKKLKRNITQTEKILSKILDSNKKKIDKRDNDN